MASHSAASEKTPNTPLSADVDLDVAWKATISKCQSITNRDLNANNQLLSIDDFVSKIKPTKHDGKPGDVKLEPCLRIMVYPMLDHFLVVMGNAHKIASGFRGKLKLGFKSLIGMIRRL
jgi:hypothetical protein